MKEIPEETEKSRDAREKSRDAREKSRAWQGWIMGECLDQGPPGAPREGEAEERVAGCEMWNLNLGLGEVATREVVVCDPIHSVPRLPHPFRQLDCSSPLPHGESPAAIRHLLPEKSLPNPPQICIESHQLQATDSWNVT